MLNEFFFFFQVFHGPFGDVVAKVTLKTELVSKVIRKAEDLTLGFITPFPP